ncbi:hypothetical protein HYQ46_000295 [Verticillium longisporum]|nr:hypothetical protein HYQ46_000295 [Verticillium longisporum]
MSELQNRLNGVEDVARKGRAEVLDGFALGIEGHGLEGARRLPEVEGWSRAAIVVGWRGIDDERWWLV